MVKDVAHIAMYCLQPLPVSQTALEDLLTALSVPLPQLDRLLVRVGSYLAS